MIDTIRPRSAAHSRSTGFSNTMSDRFFTDNSLGSKQRALLHMKRKQEKILTKRQEQVFDSASAIISNL